ncbi:MAG: ABC transporter ATP-binding protein [Deltaproteobacteria bacterium]|nr:ABC transporter ATP-binding protein [Deltaproteobacteria bacterium]
MGNPLIDIQHLSLSLGGKAILQNISLAVPRGDMVSLIGPNGAGKTSLLKCLIRIYTPAEGDIKIDGQSLQGYGSKALARRISYVPQEEGGSSPFTVREYVSMGRYPYFHPFSSSSAADKEAIRSALAITGMSAFADRSLGTLSGGERQKASIAAALAQGAEMMLLDEPSAFLDPRNQADILALLSRINHEQGVTILSVTHDINTAAITSRHAAALVEGKLAYWGGTDELMENDILKKIYGISFLFASHPKTGVKLVIPDAP